MRSLVLMHNGKPMLTSITAAPVKRRILEMPDDDADLFAVWSVPADDSLNLPADITEQFALTWAKEFRFGDGIEKAEVLAPFPAFIREIAGDKLLAKWQADIVAALPILPNPIKRHVAA
jgi:hypothetical protein